MAKPGIWTSPTEFQAFGAADKTRSLSQEIATRQRSIDFYSLGMYLPNPDPVLKKMGKDITVYKELRADAIVRGCIVNRKARTKKLIWEIDRGKSKSRQAKFVADAIAALPVRKIINKILDAPLFGYQPFEVMWDKQWTPANLVAKPQQWFVFDENNRPRFLTKTNMMQGEELPEKKFIFATNDDDYENPYGDPVLGSCFWPVTFRKGGYKFWVTFTEKFGMPFIVGKQPRGTNQPETDAFAVMLERMVVDAIAVIPDDASVEIPETKNTGSADLYDKLIDACGSDINVAILGHEAGAKSTPGKLGGEAQVEDTTDNVGDDDKHLVEDVFNTLIDWICEYKFSERAAEKPRFIMYEEEDVDTDLAARDEKLTTALDKSRLRLSKKYYQKGYALEDEDLEKAPEPVDQGTGFRGQEQLPAQFSASSAVKKGFADQAALDAALEDLSPEELQTQMEGVLKPVIDLINYGSSYEDIMKDLTKAHPKMKTDQIEEMLRRAIFVSEVWGRIQAAEEEKGKK